MRPGVDAVDAVPGMDLVLVVGLVLGMFILFSLVAAAFAEEWRRAAVRAAMLAVVLGAVVAYAAPRLGTWQELYDYEATWARLEARYDVELSEADKAVELPGRPGRYGGGILSQRELGPVTMPDGTVREDLYLQHAAGEPLRIAIVTRPPGVNDLVVTTGPWWDEIPVPAAS